MVDFRLSNMRRRAVVAAAVSAVALAQLLFVTAVAQAAMDLVLADTPDIFAGFIQVRYDDPVPETLEATGYALQLKDNAGTVHNIQQDASNPFVPGSFTLTAGINHSGKLMPGGTLAIGGYIPALGYNSGSILTGSLTALGSGAAQDALEFLFKVTGGDAADLYGGVNAIRGLILHTTAFPGDFSGPFLNNNATSDLGNVVPEPATMVIWPLLGIAGITLEWRRRRRSAARGRAG